MAEEYTTMRDLGFDFGPDPFGDKAVFAAMDAFVHKPGFTYFAAIMGACVVYWIYTMLTRAAERRDSVVIGQGREAQIVLRREAALREIRARDPGFEEALFLERAKAIFLKMQEAMNRKQPWMARAGVSDGVYERMREELAVDGAAGVRDRVGELTIKDATALGYATGWHYDSISVGFKVSAVRERLDEKTNKVLDGGPAEYEEVWTFVRRPSAKTLNKPGAFEGQCPSCGAGLTIVDSARCENCKAWINSGEYDWIAVESTVPWEWRFPDPRRELTGWNDLREDDPGLSLESLDDRAAVVFWRWLAAKRTGKTDALKGLATPEFLASFEAADAVPEALLGAVEAIAFAPGEEKDEVHLQVRWEAGRERRTDYMIFSRKAGATTNWKAGLSATRCASCGAPTEEAGLGGVCKYCNEPLGWLLARIEAFGDWKRPPETPAITALPGVEWGGAVPPMEALSAMALMITADGAVHDRERAYLINYAGARGVPTDKAEALIEDAKNGRIDLPEDAETVDQLLRGLVRVSLADGFIEEGERALLLRAARKAGLHELELKALIKEEREALAAKARALLARLDGET